MLKLFFTILRKRAKISFEFSLKANILYTEFCVNNHFESAHFVILSLATVKIWNRKIQAINSIGIKEIVSRDGLSTETIGV
jgi:hypothetical protein